MSAVPHEVSVTTQPLSFQYQPDDGPARYRIGLIALDSDVATERDFHNMLPDDVMYYTTRIQHFNPVNLENLRRMVGGLTAATEKLIPTSASTRSPIAAPRARSPSATTASRSGSAPGDGPTSRWSPR